jgi:hypothetical protein
MPVNTNITMRYLNTCPGRYPPCERILKDGYWTIRTAPFHSKIPTDIKTDGSAGELDQTLMKVW